MALPGNGKTISASLINVELKRSASAAFSMGGAAERKLAGKTSGAISLSDFWGKSSYTPPAVRNPLSPIPSGSDDRRNYFGADAHSSFNISGNGTWLTTGNVTRLTGTWLTAGSAADVEVKITPTSGRFNSNNAGNWRSVASGAFCSITATRRLTTCIFTVQFRNKKTGAILSTTTGCRLFASASNNLSSM